MVQARGSALGLMFLLAAACGGGDSVSSDAPPPTTGTPAATATNPLPNIVPDVVVRDLRTGADVNLRALGRPDRPTLYWFWAPH